MKFTDLNLIEPIQKAITKEKYVEATPIQEEAIPHMLAGKDVMGIAQTGTGKTAAFVLPLLQKLISENKPVIKNRPRALILAPTRELAAQIHDSCKTYGRFTNLKYAVVFGGVNQGPQVKALSKGVDILIATPGRLLDLIDQRHIKLENVETFILDEADRMLDMGFVPDIKQVYKMIKKCQTVMFTATMSKEIEKLAKEFLVKPVVINVVPEGYTTIDRINQELYFVDKTKKIDLLLHLMEQELDHVIIFTRTKAAADKVAKVLSKNKFKADAIHGDKSQAQRTRVLKNFSQGKIILVATDVAARGIDVDGISHVINFDLPNEPENYVHRIGRTARAGAEGSAYSFCDETEKEYLKAIEKTIKQKINFVEHVYHSEAAKNSTQKPPRRGGNRNLGIRGRKSRSSEGYAGRNSGKKSRFSKDKSKSKKGKFEIKIKSTKEVYGKFDSKDFRKEKRSDNRRNERDNSRFKDRSSRAGLKDNRRSSRGRFAGRSKTDGGRREKQGRSRDSKSKGRPSGKARSERPAGRRVVKKRTRH